MRAAMHALLSIACAAGTWHYMGDGQIHGAVVLSFFGGLNLAFGIASLERK